MVRIFLIFIFIFYTTTLLSAKTVVDMYGRSVSIPPKVEHVVSAGGTPAVNAFLLALDSKEMISNGLPGSINGKNWSNQLWFDPSLADKPVVSSGGPDWNVNEEVLSSIPHDVVFVVNPMSAERLSKKGFSTVALNWENPDSVKNTMTLLGSIIGKEKNAKNYNFYFDQMIHAVSKKVGTSKEKPKALYMRYTNLSVPMVSTATWMIENAGGINVAKGIKDHGQIDIERLLVWNPDYLFVWNSKEVEAVYADSRLSTLSAVKNKKIYVVPMGAHVWTHYTPEMPLAVVWAAGIFYPEKFKDMKITDVMSDFYLRFYGTNLSEEQKRKILNP